MYSKAVLIGAEKEKTMKCKSCEINYRMEGYSQCPVCLVNEQKKQIAELQEDIVHYKWIIEQREKDVLELRQKCSRRNLQIKDLKVKCYNKICESCHRSAWLIKEETICIHKKKNFSCGIGEPVCNYGRGSWTKCPKYKGRIV
jgi:hypothetical protein